MSGPAIVARGVGVTIGATTALRGVSFEVRPGEACALIGPNGAGKSTLLRSLAGLQATSRGTIEIAGRSLRVRERRPRGPLGYVFQRAQLLGSASVLTNVVHGGVGLPGGWRCFHQATAPSAWRHRALDQLDRVGIADKARRPARTLSGGEAQRCAIARALVRRPRVLLADEPTAALDPSKRREVLRLLVDAAHSDGAAVIVSTHSTEDARACFDRVIALREGECVADAAAADFSDARLDEVYAGAPPTTGAGAR